MQRSGFELPDMRPHDGMSGCGPAPDAPEWFRSAIAAPSVEQATLVNGCRIVYRVWGHGDRLVVLAHGRSANTHWWDHLAPFFDDCRVVAVDFSGHGESGRRSDYDADTWAQELSEVITIEQARLIGRQDTGRVQRAPVLIGHSMGATVALVLAAQGHPPLSGVVAIDPPIGVPHIRSAQSAPQPKRYHSRGDAESRFRISPADRFTPDYMIRHLATHSVRQVGPNEWTSKTDPQAMVPTVIQPAALGYVDVPALLITAGAGIATRESLQALLCRMNADTVEIPECGHHVLLDRPRALAAILRNQLERWD